MQDGSDDGYRQWCPPGGESIECLWVCGSSTRPHRVVPDACVDVLWRDDELFVVGPDTAAFLAAPSGPIAGVRFRPGRAGAVLGTTPAELLNTRVALIELWGSAGQALHERLRSRPDPVAAAVCLAEAVTRRAPTGPADDPAVDEAVRRIRGSAGQLDLAALARDLGVGQRQLRDRVRTRVGYGPKMLARVARLQAALSLLRRVGPDIAQVAVSAGYADQPHLTREMRDLAGATPGQLRAEFFKTAPIAFPT